MCIYIYIYDHICIHLYNNNVTLLYCLLVRSSVFWALMRSLCCFASHVLSCVWQMASVPWVHPGSWLEESACFSIIYLLNIFFPGPGCPVKPAMRRNQQDWPMPSTSPSPDPGQPRAGRGVGPIGSMNQEGPNGPPQLKPPIGPTPPAIGTHPTLSPTTLRSPARPISRLLLPMRKRARLPPVHAWLPPPWRPNTSERHGNEKSERSQFGTYPLFPFFRDPQRALAPRRSSPGMSRREACSLPQGQQLPKDGQTAKSQPG